MVKILIMMLMYFIHLVSYGQSPKDTVKETICINKQQNRTIKLMERREDFIFDDFQIILMERKFYSNLIVYDSIKFELIDKDLTFEI